MDRLPGGPSQWSGVTLHHLLSRTAGVPHWLEVFTGTFAGHAAYYHPGDDPGYLFFAGWIPDRSASVVILANDASVKMVDLLRRLLPTALEP